MSTAAYFNLASLILSVRMASIPCQIASQFFGALVAPVLTLLSSSGLSLLLFYGSLSSASYSTLIGCFLALALVLGATEVFGPMPVEPENLALDILSISDYFYIGILLNRSKADCDFLDVFMKLCCRNFTSI